jgi:hypothetical protein
MESEKLSKRQKLIQRMYAEWNDIFKNERVFFIIKKGFPATYSPRYKGKRDYSRPTIITIKHNLDKEANRKRLDTFCKKISEGTHRQIKY